MGTLLSMTLFGSGLLFWLSVIAFVVICFISDVIEEGGWAFAALVILGILYYFKADLTPLLEIFTPFAIFAYLVLGLLFSALRTFFAGRKLGKKIKDLPKTRDDIKGQSHIFDNQKSKREDFINELKGNVFRWWFMWPVSLLTWIATDFVKEFWDFIYSKVKRFYTYLVDLGIKSA